MNLKVAPLQQDNSQLFILASLIGMNIENCSLKSGSEENQREMSIVLGLKSL